jgi:hypothetical protein
MDAIPYSDSPVRRPGTGRSSRPSALERAWHYQDLARLHPDEAAFWLSRASYLGRMFARS